MKKKLLCGALLGLMGVAHSAMAEEQLDDRWYFTGGIGYGMLDSERQVDEEWSGHLGFGRFVAPRWSWDAELYYVNPESINQDLN